MLPDSSLHPCLLCSQSPDSGQPTPTGSDSSYLSALICCSSYLSALILLLFLPLCPHLLLLFLLFHASCSAVPQTSQLCFHPRAFAHAVIAHRMFPSVMHTAPLSGLFSNVTFSVWPCLTSLLKLLTPLYTHSYPSPLLYFSPEHLPPSNILTLFNILTLHKNANSVRSGPLSLLLTAVPLVAKTKPSMS